MGLYAKTQKPVSEASSRKIRFIHYHSSSGKGLVVIGPNHGPRVDAEQGTAPARYALTITYAKWIACVLAAVHPSSSGNGAVVASRVSADSHLENQILPRPYQHWLMAGLNAASDP